MVKLTFTLSLGILCHRRYKCLQNGIFNQIALQGNYGFISLKKASELVSLLAVLLLFFLLLVQ